MTFIYDPGVWIIVGLILVVAALFLVRRYKNRHLKERGVALADAFRNGGVCVVETRFEPCGGGEVRLVYVFTGRDWQKYISPDSPSFESEFAGLPKKVAAAFEGVQEKDWLAVIQFAASELRTSDLCQVELFDAYVAGFEIPSITIFNRFTGRRLRRLVA